MTPTYPDQINPESIATVIEIARNGEYKARYPELLLHGWWLQGSLQKIAVGQPKLMQSVPGKQPNRPKLSEVQFVLALEQIRELESAGKGIPQRFFDKGILLQVIAFLIQKLLEAASK